MSEQTKVTGIVLSVYPVGENDRRLTILTKERGKIQVFARGSRRPKTPFVWGDAAAYFIVSLWSQIRGIIHT